MGVGGGVLILFLVPCAGEGATAIQQLFKRSVVLSIHAPARARPQHIVLNQIYTRIYCSMSPDHYSNLSHIFINIHTI